MPREQKRATAVPSSGAGLGTFGGVYTPSILTILGVIMYLRFGWVVGNVGLLGTLAIVTIATGITFLTALSVAEIATDRRVRVGGAYYMISRALGLETGGAVGIPLYLAQALSVPLYTIGFAESLHDAFPSIPLKPAAIVVTLFVAALALRSARAAIKAQYVIMAVIALSLLSLVLGKPIEATEIEMWGVPASRSVPFWTVFAVFFPAVTGIMAGVNMSGDLKDPARSIPKGTLAAVGTGYVIYMGLPVILALRADASTLVADPLVMRRMALWGDAILLGVWGATLSSAVGSILAAPRVLQALARDGVLPSWMSVFGRGTPDTDEPRAGTILTLGLALVAVILGDLNAIAPVLTMFFLTTYLVLNVAAGTERFLGSPSFRPSFKVHWSLSLAGAVGCAWVMLLINPLATAAAAVVIAGIFLWLKSQELRAAWGGVGRGVLLTGVRSALLRLSATPDTKTWRPHLLVLSGAPTRRWHLVEFADQLTHARGIVTVASVIPAGSRDAKRQAAIEQTIREYLARSGVQALVRLVTAPDPFQGAEILVEAYGLGPLVPNSVLLGASEELKHRDRYCEMLAHFHRAGRNVLVLRLPPGGAIVRRRRIDVWWGGLQANGGLMMVLAYLLRTSVEWGEAEVTLKLVVPTEAGAAAARENLRVVAEDLRMGARAEVIVGQRASFRSILRASSAGADLVLLGMAEPGEDFRAYYDQLQETTAGLPPTLFVLAAEEMPFRDVLL